MAFLLRMRLRIVHGGSAHRRTFVPSVSSTLWCPVFVVTGYRKPRGGLRATRRRANNKCIRKKVARADSLPEDNAMDRFELLSAAASGAPGARRRSTGAGADDVAFAEQPARRFHR